MSDSIPETGGPAPPVSPVAPGDVIGERYVVGSLIGEGGMGVVCEATHVALGVPVAIKLIRPAYKHDTEFVQRFLNEARRAALLKGEHVARVHDVGQLDTGEPYLVMERLQGVELDAYLNQAGPLLQADAVALVLQVCDGLAEAHAQGVVHRDIKPGNLFLVHLPNGRVCVKILDFGISKQLEDDKPSTLTNRDRSLGSPWYMSPEQMMDSSSVDHRSDVWSLGIVLYELLTNERPFDGSTVPEVCAKVLTGTVPPLQSLHGPIDPALQAVVFRCLAKDPNDRYPDVLALADALQQFAPPRRDTAGYRTWEPEGDLFPRARTGTDLGSMAPLATTRKLGVVPPRSRRARALGVLGIALSLVIAGGALAKLYLGGDKQFVEIRIPALNRLNPDPEGAPLDRENHSIGIAVGSQPTVTPLATAVDPADAGVPDGAEPPVAAPGESAMTEAPPVPPRASRPVSSPYDDYPYGAPVRVRPYGTDLRDALGRARDEYRRSLGVEEGAPPEPEERSEPASESHPEESSSPSEAPSPARDEPKDDSSSRARDSKSSAPENGNPARRYGI